jgi:glycosyltransferase involved in cell wall biosynthesis
LKIVGAGPASERLRKEYPEVEFCGYRTGDELHTLVSQSSFVVIPSLCNENCSMAALEGMAYGKPIIASRIGGLPEQVDEGKTGFLFRPGDVEDLLEKMEALIRNRPQRKEMGSAGREKVVLNYSFEGHCSGLLKVYDEVLNAVRDLDRRG